MILSTWGKLFSARVIYIKFFKETFELFVLIDGMSRKTINKSMDIKDNEESGKKRLKITLIEVFINKSLDSRLLTWLYPVILEMKVVKIARSPVKTPTGDTATKNIRNISEFLIANWKYH